MDRLQSRSEAVLKTIVSEYIAGGEPVGSRTVSKSKGIGLSPASVRNIMSDLTDSGYITQPHISAGRIPTDRGYRVYVNSILALGPTDPRRDWPVIESEIRSAGADVRDMLRRSSSVLAGLSRQTGVVTATGPEDQRVQSIEFINVADERILVVLVSSGGYVQNKLIQDEDRIAQDTLEKYARMLNDMLKDLDLRQARERIERELNLEKTAVNAMLAKVLRLGHAILAQEATREVFIEGKTNILDEPEFSNIGQLKALLIAFEEKSKLLKILDKTLQAEGMQVFIGSELELDEMETCALVAYPIRAGREVTGSIAVIGPKRMHYPSVVSLVETTGRVLTRLLKQIVENAL